MKGSTRSFVLGLIGVAALSVVGVFAVGERATANDTVHVYKTPTCGCCSKWIDALEAAGFKVASTDLPSLAPIKRQHGVTADLSSCHTALIGDYVIEGHVPPPGYPATPRREAGCRRSRRSGHAARFPRHGASGPAPPRSLRCRRLWAGRAQRLLPSRAGFLRETRIGVAPRDRRARGTLAGRPRRAREEADRRPPKSSRVGVGNGASLVGGRPIADVEALRPRCDRTDRWPRPHRLRDEERRRVAVRGARSRGPGPRSGWRRCAGSRTTLPTW